MKPRARGASLGAEPRSPALAGIAAALAAFGVFAAVAVAALRFGAFATLDEQVAAALGRHASPALTAFMAGVSAWHAPHAIVALMVVAALVLLLRRNRAGALLLVGAVLGGATLNHLLKQTIRRPRPGLEHLLAATTDYSFPSGHVANATLLYGALAALVVQHAAPRPLRWAGVACAALLVALAGCSRLVLEAHRLSDVLAALPVGLGWLALCLGAAAALRR